MSDFFAGIVAGLVLAAVWLAICDTIREIKGGKR
jgi:hypothetical protein